MENFMWAIILILGTIAFAFVFFKCNITYIGCGGIIFVWGLCVLGVGIVISIIGEIAGGLFSIAWVLIKLGAIVATVITIGKYIRNKLNGVDSKEN